MTKHTQIHTRFYAAIATVGLLSSAAVSYAQTPMETRSMPAISLSPDIVDVGEVSRVEITITSPNHSRELQPGDTFTLDADLLTAGS